MNKNIEREPVGQKEKSITVENLTEDQREVLVDQFRDPDNFIQYLYPSFRSQFKNDFDGDEMNDGVLVKLIVDTVDEVVSSIEEDYSEDEIRKYHRWLELELESKTQEEIDQIIDEFNLTASEGLSRDKSGQTFAQRFEKMIKAYQAWEEVGEEKAKEELADFVDFFNTVREKVYRKLTGEELADDKESKEFS
jgi:hypothetical protein